MRKCRREMSSEKTEQKNDNENVTLPVQHQTKGLYLQSCNQKFILFFFLCPFCPFLFSFLNFLLSFPRLKMAPHIQLRDLGECCCSQAQVANAFLVYLQCMERVWWLQISSYFCWKKAKNWSNVCFWMCCMWPCSRWLNSTRLVFTFYFGGISTPKNVFCEKVVS